MRGVPTARARARFRLALAMAAVLGMALAGCSCSAERAPCARDDDCADGEVCYIDELCLPATTARHLGAQVGRECRVLDGRQSGCSETETCRFGVCDGRPEFAGADVAVSDGPAAVMVRWSPAVDQTLADEIVYHVFVATEPGAYDFTAPAVSVTGEACTPDADCSTGESCIASAGVCPLSARIEGLDVDRRYHLVVRAEDQYGQREENTHEVTAMPGCVEFETQMQPIFAICRGCHTGAAAPRQLVLDAFDTLMVGSEVRKVIVPCQSELSFLYMKVSQAIPPVGNRMPFGGPYLDDAQIETIRRWIDQGATPTCPVDRSLCANGSPPTFGGLQRATLIDDTHAELCWDPANDDATASDDIVYEVYEAIAPGEQDFTNLPRRTTEPGQTCTTLSGRIPGEQYCWVVRARDQSANYDDNTVEQCLTIPPTTCVDFEEVVQLLFRDRCIHCHGGPTPLRNMSLESYMGAIIGGSTGNEVIGCLPDESLMYLKISMDSPPRGVRMPADGPPYLSDAQIAAIRRWMEEGARASCADPDPC